MATVISMHEIELRPGVAADAFECFLREAVTAITAPYGMTIHILRGDRGERSGKYLFLAEFNSVETRNRLYPAPGTPSEEMRRFLGDAQIQQILGIWGTMATIPDQGTVYADYVIVAAGP